MGQLRWGGFNMKEAFCLIIRKDFKLSEKLAGVAIIGEEMNKKIFKGYLLILKTKSFVKLLWTKIFNIHLES